MNKENELCAKAFVDAIKELASNQKNLIILRVTYQNILIYGWRDMLIHPMI